MRVITGIYGGRRLKTPKNYDVRPTTDKVKEAVFSMLLPYFENSPVCMDVFTGTGGMGIEALSRGASRVYFSDVNRESLALAKENINLCGALDQSILLLGDFKQTIKRVREKVDIYFLDPPYADGFIIPALKAIELSGNAQSGCIAVCEHSQRDKLPEEIENFKLIKDRRYGSISVSIYERQ